jgi:hypothetical protein
MTKPAINMQYRLLRNNKESGPFTKAQLEEMGLKPYDLLWIEGRGGAWLYASEIDELKSIAPVVEEQPYDRFFKGKEKQASPTSNKQNASSIVNPQTTALKSPKPRFRISGNQVVMIDDAARQQPQQAETTVSTVNKTQQPAATAVKSAAKQEIGAHIQSVGVDWEDMYSEWKGEDKPSKEQEAAAPAKTQTIEEVSQRYEEAKRKQFGDKQNKIASPTKQNIMATAAIAVLIIGGYAGYKLNNGSNNSQRSTQVAPVEKADVVQDENNQQQNTNDVSQNNTDASTANTTSAAQQTPDNTAGFPNEIKNSLSANNSNTNTQALPPIENKGTAPSSKKEQQIATEKTSITNSVGKPNQKTTQQASLTEKNKVNSPANTNNTAPAKDKKEDNVLADSKKVNTTTPVQTPTSEQPATVKPAPPAKKISDYITVSKLGSNSNSVQNVLLSVKNVTDFPIDLAVIDIQYYGTNGRYQKGETMYVKNIEAGSNVNVRIPDSKTSRSVTYKVSLVSSEQKTLYLVGD